MAPQGLEHLLRLQSELAREFRRLNDNYSLNLPFLRVSLAPNLKSWGEFHGLDHSILLNREMVLTRPWHITLEILKHEMAHAWVFFHAGSAGETDHGPLFQGICDRLGLSSWARRATGSLDDIPEKIKWSDVEDPVLRRIEKLLALAQSSNENEAALAMEKARLLAKNHRFERREEETFTYLVINLNTKRVPAEISALISILTEFFFVDIVQSPSLDPVTVDSMRVLYVCGRKRDVLMAEYVFFFMRHTIDQLWLEFKAKNLTKGQTQRRSYQLGLIRGFWKKLSESQQKDQKPERGEQGLILQEEQQLRRYLRRLFPYIQTQSSRGISIHASTYAQGQSDGRKITLSKPVSDRRGFGGFLT